MKIKSTISLLTVLILSASPLIGQNNPPASKIKIVLVGDSTVTDNAGWGLGFKQFLKDDAECINTSRGGRSSMSFINEGRWTNALALHGDYYLIQFGHNNQPGKPGRSTDMPTYVSNLVQYVDDARAIGAKPILVTPMTRREWDKQKPGKIKSGLDPWATEVRKVAAEKNVPLVDLHARSIELCESVGPEKCREFSPIKTSTNSQTAYDGTHLKGKGYVMFAQLVVDELHKTMPELSPLLRKEPLNANPVASETKFDAVVSADGSGTHTTVQAAVDASPTNANKPFVILVKPGRHQEHVFVPASRIFITLRGEPEELQQTIITGGLNVKTPTSDGKTVSTRDSSTVLVQGSDFTAENITFENTTTREDKVQALAMYVEADRAVFRKCRFLGWQDTLRTDAPRNRLGRQYYADCYIEGHVDFIYAGGTAVFDRCHIHVKADGYITAASTPESTQFGYVFLDCKVTAGPAVEKGFYLGRPWRSFAATAFLRCEFPAQLRPEGWHNWGNPTNEITVRYSEFNSSGPGANSAARTKWAKQLTDEEAKNYTTENILKGKDGWSPEREK